MGCEHECVNEHRLKELESAVHEMKEKHSKRDGVFFERINALEQKIALYNNDPVSYTHLTLPTIPDV